MFSWYGDMIANAEPKILCMDCCSTYCARFGMVSHFGMYHITTISGQVICSRGVAGLDMVLIRS